jgi:hypothetical protein
MLDSQLLYDFMRGFYGYGNRAAKYWFIGLEEGGGKSIDELGLRLEAWTELGRPQLADLKEFHNRARIATWMGNRPPLQSTWKQLIRIVLSAEGLDTNPEAVRAYQRDFLGRRHSDTAIIELMPLASKSIVTWPYAAVGEAISDRATYSAMILPDRISGIRDLIDRYRPQIVVFYGLNARDTWSALAGGVFVKAGNDSFGVHSTSSTLYLLTKHPVAYGASNAEFEAVGRYAAAYNARA